MADAAIPPGANGTYGATGTMDLAVIAAQQGAADAREAADKVMASAGLFMARFVYTTCYTLSYGVVFPSLLLARSIPRDNAAVRGLVDGAGAAEAKVSSMFGDAILPAD